MKHLSTYMQRLITKLRRKYCNDNNIKMNDLLSNILWYSIPIVYPEHFKDTRIALSEISKVNKRRWRYKKYVKGLVLTSSINSVPCFLISLTFDDDCLNSTSEKTRKDYVRRYLGNVCDDYFACVDFGKINKREHYHAIVSVSSEVSSFKAKRRTFYKFADDSKIWSYGFSSMRLLKSDDVDIHKTLNYALKASNYSFKSADSNIKPFHKTKVAHIEHVDKLDELPY